MKKLIILLSLFIFSSLAFAQTSLSNEDYAILFFKKLNQTQTKLTYMNKKGSLAKVGTETINGDISGTLFYDVKIKGLGAVVTLRYTNYSDEDGWTFDGEIITKSNMTQNGTLDGIITVIGDYAGKVYYENAILKDGNPGDGTYGIEQNNQPREEVSYQTYLKSKEN